MKKEILLNWEHTKGFCNFLGNIHPFANSKRTFYPQHEDQLSRFNCIRIILRQKEKPYGKHRKSKRIRVRKDPSDSGPYTFCSAQTLKFIFEKYSIPKAWPRKYTIRGHTVKPIQPNNRTNHNSLLQSISLPFFLLESCISTYDI